MKEMDVRTVIFVGVCFEHLMRTRAVAGRS